MEESGRLGRHARSLDRSNGRNRHGHCQEIAAAFVEMSHRDSEGVPTNIAILWEYLVYERLPTFFDPTPERVSGFTEFLTRRIDSSGRTKAAYVHL